MRTTHVRTTQNHSEEGEVREAHEFAAMSSPPPKGHAEKATVRRRRRTCHSVLVQVLLAGAARPRSPAPPVVKLDRGCVLEPRLGTVRPALVAHAAPGALVELVAAVVTVTGVDVVAVARLADAQPVHLLRHRVAVRTGMDRDQRRDECGRGDNGCARQGARGQGEAHQLAFLGRLRGELSGSGARVARLLLLVRRSELHPKDACWRPENLWVPRSRQSGVLVATAGAGGTRRTAAVRRGSASGPQTTRPL